LQRTIEWVGRVHDDIGKRRSFVTVGRPAENAPAVERVIGGRIPAQLLALIQPKPRHTGSEEGRVGFCRRGARRQIEV
jgi:hypothetical protein